MKIINLINHALMLKPWVGESIAELDDVKARLFRLTPDKKMEIYEEGHPVNEWLIVLSGEIRVETPDNLLNLVSGDSLIIPPGTVHRLNVNAEAIGIIIRDMKKAPAR